MIEHKKPKLNNPPQKKPQKPQTNHNNSTDFQPCNASSLLLKKKKIRKLVKLKEAAKKIKMLTVALETVYKIKMRCSEEMHTTIKRL